MKTLLYFVVLSMQRMTTNVENFKCEIMQNKFALYLFHIKTWHFSVPTFLFSNTFPKDDPTICITSLSKTFSSALDTVFILLSSAPT